MKEPPHIGVNLGSRIEAKVHPRTGNCLRRLRHEDPHCKALNIELKMNSQLERMLARRLDPKIQYVTAPISQCHNNIGLREHIVWR